MKFVMDYITILLFGRLISCIANTRPPHIIMIVADDLGFDDVGFHGSTQISTPNIDRLAKDGIILNNYYVLPSCSPTRSAMLTGRYPIHNGMQSGTIYGANAWGVDLKDKMLPQYLKNLGYTTHAVGKWHLGFFAKEYTPTHRGFDTFYGFYGGQADYWDHSLASNGYWGLDLHKDTPTSSEVIWNQWGNYSSKMFSMEAIDRIRRHDKNDPLFLYLSYQSVHSANLAEEPLQVPQAWLEKFNHIQHRGRRKYAAMVSVMDHGVGKVIKELEKRKMLDDSVIIFTSDNGGPANGLNKNWASNYPLRGVKTTLFEGGVKAAGFVYSKLFKNTARVSTDLMHATDWLPTILSLAGQNTKELDHLDGMDLTETFQYGVPSPRKEILLNIDPLVFRNAALRVGDWKIISQSRFFDGWYTPPQRNKKLKEKKAKRFSDLLTNELPDVVVDPLAVQATIKCGPRPTITTHCGADQDRLCLFNLKNDPCEYVDVSKEFPIIYRIMLAKLSEYKKKMVKPRHVAYQDPKSNPKIRNGVWLPWVTLKTDAEENSSYFSFFNKFPYSLSCSLKAN